ncbi:hypothetical protein BC351_03945 [Paenibacillus ferrarius]|uniref:Uncharacterized protein n=1 Tax=Paenibacillus ferrarius TaxID=1469647 RepID=A0A1V4HLD9_9BACL|nr:hypothetical protein BC351_03945 [Paenibacillus ferrarius]
MKSELDKESQQNMELLQGMELQQDIEDKCNWYKSFYNLLQVQVDTSTIYVPSIQLDACLFGNGRCSGQDYSITP